MDCICIILIVSAVGKYAEMIPESFRVGFFVCRNSSREEFSCLKQRAICGILFIRRISNFCQTKYKGVSVSECGTEKRQMNVITSTGGRKNE